jgi:hypothetical protein
MFISGPITDVRNFTSYRPNDFNPPKQSGIYVPTALKFIKVNLLTEYIYGFMIYLGNTYRVSLNYRNMPVFEMENRLVFCEV